MYSHILIYVSCLYIHLFFRSFIHLCIHLYTYSYMYLLFLFLYLPIHLLYVCMFDVYVCIFLFHFLALWLFLLLRSISVLCYFLNLLTLPSLPLHHESISRILIFNLVHTTLLVSGQNKCSNTNTDTNNSKNISNKSRITNQTLVLHRLKQMCTLLHYYRARINAVVVILI